MQASYPTVYRDKFGEEVTTIYNDGQELRMIVRGVEFVSNSFHSFNCPPDTDQSLLERFTLS